MNKGATAAGLAAAVIGTVVATGGVASAAPSNAKNAEVFPLTCDNGQTYTVVVNGGGKNQEKAIFSPGFIVGSNQHINPVAFGTFSLYVNGELVASEPGSSRGNGRVPPNATPITCTFSETMTDPAGNTYTFSGSVTGYIPGRR